MPTDYEKKFDELVEKYRDPSKIKISKSKSFLRGLASLVSLNGNLFRYNSYEELIYGEIFSGLNEEEKELVKNASYWKNIKSDMEKGTEELMKKAPERKDEILHQRTPYLEQIDRAYESYKQRYTKIKSRKK